MTADSTETQLSLVLTDTFQEIALCLGGIFLTHGARSDLVRAVMTSLGEIYEKALESSGATSATGTEARLHPAVEEFLRRLEESRESRLTE